MKTLKPLFIVAILFCIKSTNAQNLIRARVNVDWQSIDGYSYLFSDWTLGFEYLFTNISIGGDVGLLVADGDVALLAEGELKYYPNGDFTGIGVGGFLGVASVTEYDYYYGYTSTDAYLRLGIEASYGLQIFDSFLLTPDLRLGYGLNSNGGGLYFSPGGAMCLIF